VRNLLGHPLGVGVTKRTDLDRRISQCKGAANWSAPGNSQRLIRRRSPVSQELGLNKCLSIAYASYLPPGFDCSRWPFVS